SDARDCGKRRRSWKYRGGDFESAVCRRHRSVSTGVVWEDPSEMENAPPFDPGPGGTFRGGSVTESIQGDGENRVRRARFRGDRSVLYSVYLHVRGGYKACLERGPRKKQECGVDPRRQGWGLRLRNFGIAGGDRGDFLFTDSAG